MDQDKPLKPTGGSDRRFLRRVFLALLLAGFFALFVYAIKFFMLVFAGILLGVFFGATAGFINRHTFIPRPIALALTILLSVGSMVTLFWILAPTIYHQADEVFKAIMQSSQHIQQKVQQYTWGDQVVDSFRNLEERVVNGSNYVSRFKGFFSTTLGVIADILIILITGIFLAADPKLYTDGFVRLIKPSHRPRGREIMEMCYKNVRLWLLGKFASMLIVGLLFFTGLSLLDMPLAFALALISMILAFIPNIGSYLGGIIATLVALTQGTDMALYVLLLYIGIQFIEDYLLMPVINKRMIQLPPALTLFWLVLLGLSAGILGLFMAAPLLTVLIIVVREIYVKDHLEKQTRPEGQRNRGRRRPYPRNDKKGEKRTGP